MAIAYNMAKVRELLTQALSATEFEALCYDHFRAAYDDTLSLAARRQKLLEYCETHVEMESLLAQVQKINPMRYAEFAPHLRNPDPPPASDARLSPAQLAAVEAAYRRRICEQFETLTFKGISPSGRPIALPLENVYVDLKAVAEVPEAADTFSADERRLLLEAEGRSAEAGADALMHLDSLRLQRWREQDRRAGRTLERRSIQQVLLESSQPGVVILGDPGSGKTTLLHYLALRAARQPGDDPANRLPIFVPLAAFDDYVRRSGAASASLGDFLAIYYEQWRSLPGLAPLFQQALAAGRALMLLDGLDEVLDRTTRQFVAEQVGALMQQWTPRGNRFALTSRIVGYREARLPGNLPHVTVLDFGRAEIELFAQQWTVAYETWAAGSANPTALQRAAAERDRLLEDVRSNASVERLAVNPLLLTMLALLRRQVGKLPDRRIELYERYVRTLIDNWEAERSAGARREAPARFDPHRAIDHLIELALWLQRTQASGTARTGDVVRELTAICLRYEGYDLAGARAKERVQAEQDAHRFLQDMRHFAGLLAERGREAFGFLHLTFQEYFVGRALARFDPQERWAIVQPNLHNPRWREPILLAAGQLGVMEQRRPLVSAFVRQILDAQSEHETLLHRDLFLAAAIAADDVGLTVATREDLAERLAALTGSLIPSVQATALTSLAQLVRLGSEGAERCLLSCLADRSRVMPALQKVGGVLGNDNAANLRQAVESKLDDAEWQVRSAAVAALGGLVASDAGARQAVESRLDDADGWVRGTAVAALGGLVASDAGVRQAVESRLDDADGQVRSAAVAALAGLVASDAGVRQAVESKLDDAERWVRRAAVRALGGLAASDAGVRQAVESRLDDAHEDVRGAAVAALAGLAASDAGVRQAVESRLDDADGQVRRAAVEALAGLAASDAGVRQAVESKLDDAEWWVRRAAVEALAGLVASDAMMSQNLRPWLAHVGETLNDENELRRRLADAYAPLLAEDPELMVQVVAMLDSPAWPARQGAAWALIAMPSGPPAHLLPRLRGLLDDTRGEESWPARLQAAEVLLNNRVEAISRHAIAVVVQALDYATQPWYDLPWSGSAVRKQAALILGSLEPVYRDDVVFQRLVRVMHEDADGQVRDAAYGALLRLAAAPEQVAQADAER